MRILRPSPGTLLGATRCVAKSLTDAAAPCTDPFLALRHAILLTQPMDGADFAAVGHPKPMPAWMDCHCDSFMVLGWCDRLPPRSLCWADLWASRASPATLWGMCSRRPHDDVCRADELELVRALDARVRFSVSVHGVKSNVSRKIDANR